MNFDVALRSFVALLWLIVIGLVVFAVLRASRGQKSKNLITPTLIIALLALLISVISAGLVFVQPEERGVVISALQPKGYREQALSPGLRWIIPGFERVVTYPISRQTYTMSIASAEGDIEGDDSIFARTSDGQEVLVDASVIYSVDPNEVVDIHIRWQNRYTGDLVRPLARGVIRDAVSQFRIEEVYSTKRIEMTTLIKEEMTKKLDENGLIMNDFVLRNITFSEEYAASVEQKQIAEQQAQQAKFVVEQKKQEAEQARQVAQGRADAAVIQAEGAAEARLIEADAEKKALLLFAEALVDNPELLQYQYINKIAPGVQVMLLPSDSPYILPLNSITSTSTDTTITPSTVITP
ncbi:MAG: hypothetical protein JW908_04720 [Anaerolineales bacterium]|nr:hypothetical protein [Anaerolineales bacterium]